METDIPQAKQVLGKLIAKQRVHLCKPIGYKLKSAGICQVEQLE